MKLLIFFVIIGQTVFGQVSNERILTFHVRFGEKNLVLSDSSYKLNKVDSVYIDELKFYASGVTLWRGNQKVWEQQNSFHLIDVAKPTSMKVALNVPASLVFDKLTFNLGIDSTTNTSGALGGDLDPTKGMYWTWQSGYINMKLEGSSNLCTTRNRLFLYHFGGYQYPLNALQQVVLKVNNKQQLHIAFDVKGLLSQLDLVNRAEIMSPGKEAVSVSQKMVQYFTVENP